MSFAQLNNEEVEAARLNNEKPWTVVFHGFTSREEALAFASWYSGSGEQDVGMWLEERTNITSADCSAYTISTGIDCNVVDVMLNVLRD